MNQLVHGSHVLEIKVLSMNTRVLKNYELVRDQFIAGLSLEKLLVKHIGKGHGHNGGERTKITLQEVVKVAKTFEATTAINQLMQKAREGQVYEQVKFIHLSF